jgi:hypothetical protein
MSFKLSGPPTKDDIKVAYIDPKLGLVEGVSICQANEYALKEPGTTFIFRDGKQTLQYLNINEVNTIDPIILTTTDECGGISEKKECGPPTIQIFGGGGIGAAGNPIVGNDGAILAVDIVRGGNGYQFPPLIAARDVCNNGSGATFVSVIGEVVETTETFENEADFEEYEICEPTDVGYGQNWGPNGEDLGPWDPKTYTEPGEDPIRKEVGEFEELVRNLARSPYWSTRKNKPTKVTCSDAKIIPSEYNVTFPAWNEFMNSYAISPVSPSNVKGSDFAGRLFTYEWSEDFPYDGEYIFRGLCDNQAQLYFDNLKIADLASFADSVIPIQKTITKGLHNIRVDLLNVPITETVTRQSPTVEAPSSPNSPIQVKKVFNTLDYISKANRTLWRTNVNGKGGFINEFGICPFDTSVTLTDNPYAGTHTIVWNNINFPVDGSYRIRMGVDDSVTLFIGDERIRYEGFIAGTNTSNPEYNVNKFFKAGNYTVRAELEQIPGGVFGFSDARNANPMVLAIDIEVTTVTETIISTKSWNENPMGLALTIDAPEPPIPQEPILEQEGRCPNNPIWTTRFPGAKEFWFPVRHRAWADFFNRYAISPIRPLDTPGTDGGGIVFRNYWDIDIPYDGFYQFAVQRDNTARFYVDGTLAFDIKSSGDELWKDKRNKPKFQKVFITKGRHVISVELENEATEAYDQVNQKIFRTLDWQVSLPASSPQSTTIDVNFNFIGNSSAANTHNYKITELGIDIFKPRKTGLNQNITKNCVSGQVYEVEFFNNGSPGGTIIQRNDSFIEYEDGGGNTLDASINIDKGKFLNVRGNKCSFVVGEPIPPAPITGGLTGGTSRDGVTYEGPALTSYIPGYISPVFQNVLTPTDEIQGKTWIMTWKNVDFPEDGQYDLITKADDLVIIRVDGVEVGRHNLGVDGENFKQSSFNATKGKRTLELELSNLSFPNTGFPENPVYTSVEINKNVSLLRAGSGKSWDENPIGVGAILIPPPCPRKISGKGVVTDIIVTDPGNGFLPPVSPLSPPPSTVSVTPSDVPGAAAGAPGAGVGPPDAGVGAPDADVGVSPTIITIVPPSGAPTGINARFIPQFEVVRDPIVVNPQQLLQVTDLVGLKQTGYVNGRPYYGSVYYDRGIRYAGFYETVGEPVRVYDTLRESITAQVTTSPSAILRQGTDIRSNDPLLNIPGTVQSTLSSNSIVGAGDISTPSVPFTQEPVQDPIYPVSLRLKRVLVQDRGINYNVTDKIRVIPSNGAILEPIFGSFGRVVKVAVIDPGFGFTEYPRIEMYTPL